MVASSMTKLWCLRNAQICNKIDRLKGSIEISSATALFYKVKGIPVFLRGLFPSMVIDYIYIYLRKISSV